MRRSVHSLPSRRRSPTGEVAIARRVAGRSFDTVLRRRVDAMVARHAPPGVVIDARGEIVLVRGRNLPLLAPGLDPAPTNLFQVKPGELAAELRNIVDQARDAMAPVRREGLVIGAGTGLGTFEVEVSPIQLRGEAREPHFLVMFVETSAEAARAEAERANHAKDVFLATLSHELRTPLTSILLNAEHLREPDGLSAEQVVRTALVIERAARAQSQLVDDLLDVSRVLAGKLRLELKPIDLSMLVAGAAEAMRESAERRGLRFETFLDPEVGTVLGDTVRLQQVLWNLLANAIKFTPARGVVRLELFGRDDRAIVRVRDSGKGIDPRKLEAVFGFFAQEDDATTRQYGGLGLGLAIVRHLVHAHGGYVTAQSAGLGQGTTFTVELPVVSRSLKGVSHGDETGVPDRAGGGGR